MASETKKARVLIVDNDEQVLESLAASLNRRNYDVKTVLGSRADICQYVADIAGQFRPHVVVLDLRLKNEYMTDDETGLELISLFPAKLCILMSAWLTAEVTQKALEEGAFRCVRKGAGQTRRIIATVEEAALTKSIQAAEEQIKWPPKWSSELVAASIFGPHHAFPALLIDDLLFQLFGDQTSNLQIAPLKNEPPVNVSESPSHSFAATIRLGSNQPQMLKLAKYDRVQREVACYREFVENKIPGQFHTRVEKERTFWGVGGIIYSLIGSTSHRTPGLSAFYHAQSEAEKILKPLDYFFRQVWSSFYRNAKRREGITIYHLYEEVFALDTRLQRVDPYYQEVSEQLHELAHLFAATNNPAQWVISNKDGQLDFDVYEAITHGDLHAENIFATKDHAWVIDFERTGPGHVLRDFAELEIDILINLIPPEIEQAELHQLMIELASVESNNYAYGEEEAKFQHAEIQKAYAVIGGLRVLAHQATRHENQREYLWALLLDALFVASRRKVAQTKRLRAVTYAALLCGRLENWDKVWPTNPPQPPLQPKLQAIDVPAHAEPVTLSGARLSALENALSSAFNYNEFKRFLRIEFEENLENFSLNKDLKTVIFETIEQFGKMGKLEELATKAYQARPSNKHLQTFVEEYRSGTI